MVVLSISDKTPTAVLLVLEYARTDADIEVSQDQNTALTISEDAVFTSPVSIGRYLARITTGTCLYGNSILEKTEVDHWLQFSVSRLGCQSDFSDALTYLNEVLATVNTLVGHGVTLADIYVWAVLRGSSAFQSALADGSAPKNVVRYYKYLLEANKPFQTINNMVPKVAVSSAKSSAPVKKERKEEGKFIELPGAKIGEVVVRFPPEASGYLHVGHAKAALLNQFYQQNFKGKLIMRFDDTNPAKEDAHFEKVILEDLRMLGVQYDIFTHSSDSFERIQDYCTTMIKEGKAYVDSTDHETMKNERAERIESKCRNNSVEKNLSMWEAMKKGTEDGLKCGVRAKIDMASNNGCMRDPIIYRCKLEPHVRTGDKYKVYPTYDFACPIVDSHEGVTHALRTTEYHDRDDQYYWFCDAMGLRKPFIWEYSRLNLQNTVMSKRKLTWFVEQGLVEGWDDPRFPTVRGVLRRGMTVQGLKEFVIAQGSSRSVVMMDWDKIWSFNKKVIDPVVPRYTALQKDDLVEVKVKGAKEEVKDIQKHPKDPSVGTKSVWYSDTVYLDGADAATLTVGETVTFINWGNLVIRDINKDAAGKVTSVQADLDLDNKDYKKTQKLTWLARSSVEDFCPVLAVNYGHIITKPVLAPDDDFKNFVNPNSRTETVMIGDHELTKLKKGDMIQLQRRGYFICDAPYEPPSRHSSRASPCILFNIPDGHTKEMPTSGSKHKSKEGGRESNKERAQSKKGKAAEKSPQEEQPPSVPGDVGALNQRITDQGNLIRKLKGDKAAKPEIEAAVKTLLALKADYKNTTGKDWKPGAAAPAKDAGKPKEAAGKAKEPAKAASPPAAKGPGDALAIFNSIADQGNLVRKLKGEKAAKPEIDAAVKTLLALKADYKNTTGNDWKPGAAPPQSAPAPQGSDSALDIHNKIVDQGNTVRKLKGQKADKAEIDVAVKTLLALKADYKNTTGQDWKPGAAPPQSAPTPQGSDSALDIHNKIVDQGNNVRKLKGEKAGKPEIDAAVKNLLALKADYKKVSGQDWKPGAAPPQSAPTPQGSDSALDIHNKIVDQGNTVRKLKGEKADKSAVDAAVKTLLALKADYKKSTGSDWKPGAPPPQASTGGGAMPGNSQPAAAAAAEGGKENSPEAVALKAKIDAQGGKVRDLKTEGGAKPDVDAAVATLLDLKAQYKALTGTDLAGGGGKKKGGKGGKKEQPQKKEQPKKAEVAADDAAKREVKKVSRLGLEAKKSEALSDWYSQVITKAEMIEYYDVSGCYVLRPGAFGIWERIKEWFDAKIKEIGFENCYFPIFVSQAALEKEKEHIADFAPEVAWVTKSGQSELSEPVAIRPTSETVMYPSYAKWTQSHRDLPIKLNQWCNVVRWEFKHPQPFLRTREFLWQEGHSAHQHYKDAEEEVYYILDLYARVYTDLLAIAVVKGRKTEKEKFAGGDFTTTCEAYVAAAGRAIQGATSHHLGQNFSKMFDISYEDPDSNDRCYAYQNSWGITTRTIGVLTMVHGDDTGLVLPPQIANIQVVIVPCGITVSLPEAEKSSLLARCQELEAAIRAVGVRVKGDYRDHYSPGWKFNHYELKGVPVRVELGPRDLKQAQFVAVRRDTQHKQTLALDNAANTLKDLLDTIQKEMLARSQAELDTNIDKVYDMEKFCRGLDQKKLLLAPFCGDIPCEDIIKKISARDAVVEEGAPAMGAKGLCIPFTQPEDIKPSTKCICPDCGNKPKYFTLFGRSY